MRIHARQALLGEGWAGDVTLEISGGRIRGIETGAAAAPADVALDTLVPGLANLHSHAFQRGFSGLAERRGASRDSFWTWREIMYHFALALPPEGVESLAALAYAEMLEAGYTRVGEFHYLHHAPDGSAYADPAEMSARIIAAAEATGIALTHLPVFYAHGGFGPSPAGPGQRRFLHDLDGFETLLARCATLLTRPQDRLGLAPHSLRAATIGEIARLAANHPGKPLHIHAAEQLREVEECRAATGARPVEWLLDRAPLGPDWCLIHATHMTPAETAALAATGAVAGLCPITEANLGDGIFPAEAYLAASGRFGVGTDSNVAISLADELRLLEYGQRLVLRARNVLAADEGSSGARAFLAAAAGGAQALGAEPPHLLPGAPADLVGLRDTLNLGTCGDALLDRWIFGRDIVVEAVWAAGVPVVSHGRHHARDTLEAAARQTLRQILRQTLGPLLP